LGQKLYFFDYNQVMQRACICDDNPYTVSEPETPRVLQLPFNLIDRIGLKDLVRLENAIQLTASLKPEQPPQFGFGQTTKAVCLNGYGFNRLPLDIAGSAEPFSQIIGNVDNKIHLRIVPLAGCSSQPAPALCWQ
jgi:hypothetical protein